MIKIYFVTGKTIEIDNYDFFKLGPKLTHGGLRVWRPKPDTMIPLNSAGIMMIKEIETEEEQEEQHSAEMERIIAEERKKLNPTEQEETPIEPQPEKPEKKKSAQERNDEALAYMKEMSECPHEEHDIYFSNSTVGRKRTPVKRYFPVCAKCGVREKFVKADSLPDEVKEAAKLYEA